MNGISTASIQKPPYRNDTDEKQEKKIKLLVKDLKTTQETIKTVRNSLQIIPEKISSLELQIKAAKESLFTAAKNIGILEKHITDINDPKIRVVVRQYTANRAHLLRMNPEKKSGLDIADERLASLNRELKELTSETRFQDSQLKTAQKKMQQLTDVYQKMPKVLRDKYPYDSSNSVLQSRFVGARASAGTGSSSSMTTLSTSSRSNSAVASTGSSLSEALHSSGEEESFYINIELATLGERNGKLDLSKQPPLISLDDSTIPSKTRRSQINLSRYKELGDTPNDVSPLIDYHSDSDSYFDNSEHGSNNSGNYVRIQAPSTILQTPTGEETCETVFSKFIKKLLCI